MRPACPRTKHMHEKTILTKAAALNCSILPEFLILDHMIHPSVEMQPASFSLGSDSAHPVSCLCTQRPCKYTCTSQSDCECAAWHTTGINPSRGGGFWTGSGPTTIQDIQCLVPMIGIAPGGGPLGQLSLAFKARGTSFLSYRVLHTLKGLHQASLRLQVAGGSMSSLESHLPARLAITHLPQGRLHQPPI